MGTLDGVDLDDLHAALAAVEGRKAALRVAVGIAYLQGVEPAALAEWYDLSRSTVYDWLDRIERLAEEPPAEALADADRPGRPPKLSPAERGDLATTLREPPTAAGYDESAWTPGLVARHIRAAFGVEYSRRHVRDLLHGLGFEPGADDGWQPDGEGER